LSAITATVARSVPTFVRNAEKNAQTALNLSSVSSAVFVLTASVERAATAPNVCCAKTAWNRFATAATAAPNAL